MKMRRILSIMLTIAMIATMGAFTGINVSATSEINVTFVSAVGPLYKGDTLTGWYTINGATVTSLVAIPQEDQIKVDNTASGTYTVTIGFESKPSDPSDPTTDRGFGTKWEYKVSKTYTTTDGSVDIDITNETSTTATTLNKWVQVGGERYNNENGKTKVGTTTSLGSDVTVAKLNLTSETLFVPTGYTIKAFSINGGGTWKKWTKTNDAFIETKNIAKLLNKASEIVIANGEPEKGTKKPAALTIQYKFAKINARPKVKNGTPMPKLAANYALNLGEWVLATKAGVAADATKLIISAIVGKTGYEGLGTVEKAIFGGSAASGALNAASDKKSRNFKDFVTASASSLCAVKPLNAEGKPYKMAFAVKYDATYDSVNDKYTPATKEFKVNVSSELKMPKVKAKDGEYDIKANAKWATYTGSLGAGYTEGALTTGKQTAAAVNGQKIRVKPTAKKPWSAQVVVE